MLVGNEVYFFKVLISFFFQLIKTLQNSNIGIFRPVIHPFLAEKFENAGDKQN